MDNGKCLMVNENMSQAPLYERGGGVFEGQGER